MAQQRAGFTLMELLVVMAVVAILAGLLMPALSRVKETARSITCMNNMRGVSAAILAQAADNRGLLPWGFGPSYNTSWPKEVNNFNAEVSMLCPSVRDKVNNNALKFHYTGNLQALTDQNFGFSWKASARTQVNRLELTPDLPVLFDGSQIAGNGNAREMSHNIGATFFYKDNPWLSAAQQNQTQLAVSGTSFTMDKRHGNGTVANVLFGDGHVGTRQPESFTNGDLRIISKGRQYW